MIHIKDLAHCLIARKISINVTSYYILGLSLNIISSERSHLRLVLLFYSFLLHFFFIKLISPILYAYNYLCVCLLSDAPVRL